MDPSGRPRGLQRAPCTTPSTQVNVELDQLINIFDEPTRKQLQEPDQPTRDGPRGQGRNTNETFQVGQQDHNGAWPDVTDVLQARDQELRQIIDALTKLTGTLASDQKRQTYIDLLKHSDAVLKTLRDEDTDVQQGIDRMNELFGIFEAGLQNRAGDLQGVFANLPGVVTSLDNLSVNLGAKGHRSLPTVDRVLPGLVEGPIIFGSQPDKNIFTCGLPPGS